MPLPRDSQRQPEARLVRQLCEAVLYERLVEYTIRPASGGHRFEWDNGKLRCTGHVGAFGRIRLDPDAIEARDDGWWRPARLGDILSSLDADSSHLAQLDLELVQTLGFAGWNAETIAPVGRRALAYASLDSSLDEGHPYHPCFKARTGFTFEDHAAYGPEAGGTFQLCWLAVRRNRLHSALPEPEESFWRRELGPETLDVLNRRKAEAGVSDYGLLPVHPWQWHSLQNGPLSSWLTEGEAVFLGYAGDAYGASQSVRTLFNRHRPDQAAVKLPMNLVNSSAMRILEPHCVCAAPVVSRWLQAMVEADPFLRGDGRLLVLGEYAGIIADRDGPLAGQLAVIWRENVTTRLQPGEQAVPLNALMMVETDGQPFVAEWVERHGLRNWVDRLIEVTVLPVFHLFAHHGVVTEAHGQNLILIHRDGWPTGLAMQDFHDSVEYTPDFLRDPSGAPDFAAIDPAFQNAPANEFYWMEHVGLLADLFVDALFVYNLAEISHLLSHAYGLDETAFWQTVRDRMLGHVRSHGLSDRLAALDLWRPHIQAESLLTRKLRPAGASCEHKVPNSLAPVAEVRKIA